MRGEKYEYITKKRYNNIFIKCLALALALAVLLGCLQGCKGKEDGPSEGLGLIVDESTGEAKEVPWVTMVVDSQWIDSISLNTFLQQIPGNGEDFQVSCEIIGTGELTEPEHSNQLTQMRTEMMAGKGPDIFLCDCYSVNYLQDEDGEPYFKGPAFPFPEKAMTNNIFLPLNEYIENAQYMEWEKMNSTVMAAGSYKGQQLLLPVMYQFNLACIARENTQRPEDLEDWDLLMEYAAGQDLFMDIGFEGTVMQGQLHSNGLGRFVQPADYEKDVLNFSEEELLQIALEELETVRKHREGYFDPLLEKKAEAGFLSHPVNVRMFTLHSESAANLPEYWMIPSYNREGGVTAEITCFTGINANANHPELAFHVVDWLMSKEVQQGDSPAGMCYGISVYDELGSGEQPYQSARPWHLGEWNFQQLSEVREKINAARFYTVLDREFMFGLGKECRAETASEDSVEKAVHKAYTTMKMMLAES